VKELCQPKQSFCLAWSMLYHAEFFTELSNIAIDTSCNPALYNCVDYYQKNFLLVFHLTLNPTTIWPLTSNLNKKITNCQQVLVEVA